jgi:cellulose synthase/poly-beta-1,6-N-acetylglucosamine synthase-like glycosyltransferase
MGFSSTYYSRFQSNEQYIHSQPNKDVNMIVIIPCFHEPEILTTLQSIISCTPPKSKIEVLVVVNYSESVSDEIKEYNNQTFQTVEEYSKKLDLDWITIHPIFAPNLPQKHAGVGLARKTGMDEAIRRFETLNKPEGIIISFDADSTVETNYFVEIEQYFETHPKCTAANIHFEHPLQGNLPQSQYNAIAQYELHLRYYVEALSRIHFPFAYQTVGSSFALRANAYCRQGGMNKRQAGEDFYFLQKLFESETIGNITKTKVIPSARISQRVPFGTGYAMFTMMKDDVPMYLTYTFESFTKLGELFRQTSKLFGASKEEIENIYFSLHISLQSYINKDEFISKIIEIQNNSKTEEGFTKRFFIWFNGFRVFKYLNFAHIKYFEKKPVYVAVLDIIPNNSLDLFELLATVRTSQTNF